MRRIFLCIALLLAAPVFGQRNLVENPGFENGQNKAGFPTGGWWLYENFGRIWVSVDKSLAHSGLNSVCLTSTNEEKCALVSPKFSVAPGDELKFSAWERGSNIPPSRAHAYAGVAFRDSSAKILSRHYFTGPCGGAWTQLSGSATAPPGSASAEVHLGYTNGPGTIWYDDISAEVTNPLSLSLAEPPKPWSGAQTLSLRIANRQSTPFLGRLESNIAHQKNNVAINVPANVTKIIELPISLEGGRQHSYDILLRANAGKVAREITGKFQTLPALVLYPACPCYRVQDAGETSVEIDAQINVAPADRAGMNLEIATETAPGKKLTPVSSNDFTRSHVDVAVGEIGERIVTVRLLDFKGHALAHERTSIHIIPVAQSRVFIQSNGFLNVAGHPEFPIGLYSSFRNPELAAAGFNTTHNYNISSGAAAPAINPTDIQLETLLDKAAASGLRMMVELPRLAIEKAKWEQVRHRIETFRHHPGLLCWGSEERVARGTAPPANVAAAYKLVHELDPDHPFVLGDSSAPIEKLMVDRRDFFPDGSMDIGIWWWYPIPMRGSSANLLEGREGTGRMMDSPSWLTTTHSKKPLWIAIQSYQKPTPEARFPTPEEYRCQAYLSIINGVKGLFFYSGSGQRDYLGQPSGILNKPELGHWDYVKKLVAELRDFSPVIMAPVSVEKIELTATNSPVEFTTRHFDGADYIMAANEADYSVRARWRIPGAHYSEVEIMFDKNSPALKKTSDSLSDEFAPYAVRVYRLR